MKRYLIQAWNGRNYISFCALALNIEHALDIGSSIYPYVHIHALDLNQNFNKEL